MNSNLIVVTGCSGHMGYHLAKKLLKKNNILLLIRKKNIYISELEVLGAKVEIVDFNNIKELNKIISNYNILINLASKNSYLNENDTFRGNYDLTKNIFNATIDTQIKKIIHISSSVIFKRQKNIKNIINENSELNSYENDYVKGKILCEKFIDKFLESNKLINIIRLYPGWVISDDDVYLTPPSRFFFENIFNKRFLFCFDGGFSINNVEKINDAIINSLNYTKNDKFILGGINVTYKDIIKYFMNKSKKKYLILKIPNYFLKTIKLLINVFSTFNKKINNLKNQFEYSEKALTSYLFLSSKKAENLLNYKIDNINSIVNKIIKTCKKHKYNIHKFGKLNPFPNNDIDLKEINYDNKILITGCPGTLGNKFIDFIIKYNSINKDKIYCNLLIEKKFNGLINLPKEFEIYYGSLNNAEILKDSLKQVSNVFHLAAKTFDKSTKEIYLTNYVYSRNLIDILIEKKIKKIFLMSTDSVLGYSKDNQGFRNDDKYKPFGIYGKSKKELEEYIISKASQNLIEFTILRGFWFFGGYNSMKQKNFIKIITSGFQPIIGNGNNYRNISITDNIVMAFFHCLQSKKTANKIYWIGNKNYKITINDIYKQICKINNGIHNPIYLPNFLGFFLRKTFDFFSLFGYNSSLLFSLGKLNLTITAEEINLYKDTNYEELLSLKDVGYYE